MTPLKQSLAGTGTPYGWSYWAGWVNSCERASLLKERSKVREGPSGRLRLDIGTAFHALAKRYYTLELDELTDETLVWVNAYDTPADYFEEVVQKANRVFRQYRVKHRPEEFGRTLAAEKTYWLKDWNGVSDFTFQPDLEVYMTEEKAQEVSPFAKEGIYLVDHKVRARNYANALELMRDDLRFHVYNMAYYDDQIYESDRPPFRGTIINNVYDVKEVYTRRIYIPFPTPQPIVERLKGTLQRAMQTREACLPHKESIEDVTFKPNCVTWQGRCPHLDNGCRGY